MTFEAYQSSQISPEKDRLAGFSNCCTEDPMLERSYADLISDLDLN